MNEKILIVDDAKFARTLVKKALANGGYDNIIETANAADIQCPPKRSLIHWSSIQGSSTMKANCQSIECKANPSVGFAISATNDF